MGYLQQLLPYHRITLQCHNDPDSDTIASAYGVYCYLKDHGAEVSMIYSGPSMIKKTSLKMMIRECSIPLQYVQELPETDILVTVDCQYGEKNVQFFEAPELAVIDHHIRAISEVSPLYLINNSYQSCSTIVWELLQEEHYPLESNSGLLSSLLFGLYIDTSAYQDLYNPADLTMKKSLPDKDALLNRLVKSNMTTAELLIAGDALYNHYLDFDRKFILVAALTCEQAILGVIGDLVIQVDICLLAVTYTQIITGYKFSIRCCNEHWSANDIAAYISEGIGSGGGHADKAGGRISLEQFQLIYPDQDINDVFNRRICEYIDTHIF